MHIEQISIYPYSIPLRQPLRTAHGLIQRRLGAIIGVREGLTWGWGDIAPLPEFGCETLNSALSAINTYETEIVKNLNLTEPAYTGNIIREIVSSASLQNALEMACLDLLGKLHSCSIGEVLSKEYKEKIAVNAVVGARKREELLLEVKKRLEEGYRCLKLKVGIGTVAEEIERVRAVREVIGPDIHLRLDANEGWQLEQAREILGAVADCQIQYVEQPLPAEQIAEMEELHSLVTVPLAVDEALLDWQSASRLIDSVGVDVLILKPQFLGGNTACASLIEQATERGKQCVITSAFETGIGVVGALWLAAMQPEITFECGLATLDLLENDLILDSLQPKEGSIMLPRGPGLGVMLDQDALARYRLKTSVV